MRHKIGDRLTPRPAAPPQACTLLPATTALYDMCTPSHGSLSKDQLRDLVNEVDDELGGAITFEKVLPPLRKYVAARRLRPGPLCQLEGSVEMSAATWRGWALLDTLLGNSAAALGTLCRQLNKGSRAQNTLFSQNGLNPAKLQAPSGSYGQNS